MWSVPKVILSLFLVPVAQHDVAVIDLLSPLDVPQSPELPCGLLAVGEVHEHIGAAGVVDQGVAEEHRACLLSRSRKYGIVVEF